MKRGTNDIMRLHELSPHTLTRIVVRTIIVIILLRLVFVSFCSIPSPSMSPTLQEGDYVVVWTGSAKLNALLKNIAKWLSVQRERSKGRYGKRRIVSFRTSNIAYTKELPELMVKRVVAGPGDTIAIPEGFPFSGMHVVPRCSTVVSIDKQTIVQWRHLIEAEEHDVQIRNDIVYIDGYSVSSYTVEDDYYVVYGDNANNSLDSRYWGYLAERDIVGSPFLIYWSLSADIEDGSNSLPQRSAVRWQRMGTIFH